MIKIAIFHNLKQGGGFNQLKNIVYWLSKRKIIIDVYSHQNYPISGARKNNYYPITNTKNSLEQTFQTVFELNQLQKKISNIILHYNYSYIFVFPCNIVQSPHILRFLPKEKTYYFFLEPKREFYEKTSFDYYTPKRIISRLIRYPTKLFDKLNCKSTKHIISNSIFSQRNLKRIYNMKSCVIYPGMKPIKPKKITIINNYKFLSLGLLSMLKGHHISANLISNVNIYGNKSHENINKYLPRKSIVKTNLQDKEIRNIYQTHTFFFANQLRESFGLTTLEATNNNCYIFGRNEGGTPEIIINGFNGRLLTKDNDIEAKKIIYEINRKKTITFFKTCIIDWNHTVKQILNTVHYE